MWRFYGCSTGWGGGCLWYDISRRQCPRGGKMDILNIKIDFCYVTNCTESDRNTWRFCNTALSLSALVARLKAFQLPWSNSLYSIALSLWRRISKSTVLSLWLGRYFVGTSILIRTTVSLVAILYCCGWETAEKQRLPQKENVQEESLHLELLRTSKNCVRLLSELLRLRECADNKGRHLTDTVFIKRIL